MRISEQEQASQVRMCSVKVEIHRVLAQVVEQMPDLTHVELATALIEIAQRQLMHQRRAEVSETEDDR